VAEYSAIEWCDSTVNPEMGCDGCELWDPKRGIRTCYALKRIEQLVSKKPLRGWPVSPTTPTIFPGRVAQAARWKDLTGTERRKPRYVKPWLDGMPRIIFVDDMGDTFAKSLPLDWIAPELPLMAASSHQWLLLTKRPDRQRRFAEQHELPHNVWCGTSITSVQDQRLRHLMRTRAAIRYVSYEPLLAPVDWRRWFDAGLAWLIVGGASGSPDVAPMDLHALEQTVRQAQDAKVPIFVKQDSGRDPGMRGRIPDELWIRQYPTI
jgi:protein gp37